MVLPFGLSAPPQVFSKALAVAAAAAHLCEQGVMMYPYLDGCLLKAPTWKEAIEATQDNVTLHKPWPANKPSKVNINTSSSTGIHWGPSKLARSESLVTISQICHPGEPDQYHGEQSTNIRQDLPLTTGTPDGDHLCCSTSQTVHALPASVAQDGVPPTQTV